MDEIEESKEAIKDDVKDLKILQKGQQDMGPAMVQQQPEQRNNVTNLPTPDFSIDDYMLLVDGFVRERAGAMNIKRATMIGVLQLIAHNIQHECL